MTDKLQKSQDGTVEIEVKVGKDEVKKAYDDLVSEAAKSAEIKGFRKGKAPKEAVEKQLDKQKLYQQVVSKLLPGVIAKEIEKHKLRPLANPRLKPVKMKEGEDWQFLVTVAQMPEFELGDYKSHVRGALQASKIWVPGQDKSDDKANASETKETPEDKKSLADKRLKKVFDALLDNIKFSLPKMIVEDEVNKALSKLLNQVQKLGMTIDQYTQSMNKTTKQLREEYEKTAKNNLRLEFILLKVADDLKVEVVDSEIDNMIKAIPDEKTRKSFDSPRQRAYVKSVLLKRKAIDGLMKL